VAEAFAIEVEESVLDDLHERLRRTRWTDQMEGTGWDYGTDLGYLQELCSYWLETYDWRAAEKRLNQWPHFLTRVDGAQIHFIHVRSPHPDAIPLLLIHGWPGSVVEFLDVIGPLVDPPAHAGDAADAFDIVVPSLPGYAWSGPTNARGWDVRRVADAFSVLMTELGYERFGSQGGDWGGLITSQLGAHHADRLVGIHLNLVVTPPPAEADVMALPEGELAKLGRMQEFQRTETGYQAIQSTRPQTLAHGLSDSPAGLAAWIIEKFRAWSDCDGDVERAFSRDDLLTNVMAYWLTGTIGSSIRLYYETMRDGGFPAPDIPIRVPTGVAVFPREIFTPPRSWVEQHYDLRHWTEQPRGGHFAAMEQPDLFVDDVRTFFRVLREQERASSGAGTLRRSE
jgi:microsomal epoxide hydrolase